ncbi:MAG TPA: tetratricopeptide repeat protein [Spirochaetia bacterium]|nr:tetratricopeptide repeat protein [Spirochaetia bacterium]
MSDDGTKLSGKEVAFTGRLFSMTRGEAVDRVVRAGGRPAPEPGPGTSLLVAGSQLGTLAPDGSMSPAAARFRSLKEHGAGVRLVAEPEFLDLLGAKTEREDFSRLYTAEQVSRIVEVPVSVVRSWVRKGLLPPARLAHRLAWFEFTDILSARALSRLTAAGVPASRIHRSLADIARWLPDGGRILGRLEAYATGVRLRMPDGSWVEPSGQRLMDFRHGDSADATDARPGIERVSLFPGPAGASGLAAAEGTSWFDRALDAEEAGDLESAIRFYTAELDSSREPEVLFNLGNVLYELGREEQAAERYLQAIEADRGFAEAWNNLGNSLVAIGRFRDGVHAYEMALSLEPTYPEPHCNLATVLDRMGQPGQALAHRGACQSAFPSEVHLTLLRRPEMDALGD